MSQPLISVIVPVYNGQEYLAKCIACLESQTYQNLEILIVNDGSTDETASVCDKLMSQYHNVQVITMDDKGVSAARNAGIAAATGEYITFVDADDRTRADMIQTLYETADKCKCDIAGCGFFAWKDEDELEAAVKGASCKGEEKQYSAGQFLKEELLSGNSRCWSKLYSRAVIENVRFQEGLSIGEDMLFLLELLQHTDRIAEIPYQGYGYFQNPKGAMNRKFLPKYMDQITCWELARDRIRERWKTDDLAERATTILIMAIMLTVGKIAALPLNERREQQKYTDICHQKLKKELQVKGAYQRLSAGYKVKVKLFGSVPKLYMGLYHLKMR